MTARFFSVMPPWRSSSRLGPKVIEALRGRLRRDSRSDPRDREELPGELDRVGLGLAAVLLAVELRGRARRGRDRGAARARSARQRARRSAQPGGRRPDLGLAGPDGAGLAGCQRLPEALPARLSEGGQDRRRSPAARTAGPPPRGAHSDRSGAPARAAGPSARPRSRRRSGSSCARCCGSGHAGAERRRLGPVAQIGLEHRIRHCLRGNALGRGIAHQAIEAGPQALVPDQRPGASPSARPTARPSWAVPSRLRASAGPP